MKKYFSLALIALTVFSCIEESETTQNPLVKPLSDTVPLVSMADSLSYALGSSLGTGLRDNFKDVNIDELLKGVKDCINDSFPRMDQTAAKAKVVAFRNRPDSVGDKNDLAYAFGVDFASAYSTFGDMTKLNLEVYKRAVKHGLFEDQLQIDPRHASDFMTKFRREMMQQSMKVEEDKMKSVPYITTPSGLKYKVYRQGSGPKPTSPSDQVTVHYRGTLLNGTIFDSSYERQQPASFNLDQVIKGWTEGLMLMNVGSKFEFYIPSNLAYGPQGNRGIPGNSDLIFIVELLNVNGK